MSKNKKTRGVSSENERKLRLYLIKMQIQTIKNEKINTTTEAQTGNSRDAQ
jgi:hypothetical protein